MVAIHPTRPDRFRWRNGATTAERTPTVMCRDRSTCVSKTIACAGVTELEGLRLFIPTLSFAMLGLIYRGYSMLSRRGFFGALGGAIAAVAGGLGLAKSKPVEEVTGIKYGFVIDPTTLTITSYLNGKSVKVTTREQLWRATNMAVQPIDLHRLATAYDLPELHTVVTHA